MTPKHLVLPKHVLLPASSRNQHRYLRSRPPIHLINLKQPSKFPFSQNGHYQNNYRMTSKNSKPYFNALAEKLASTNMNFEKQSPLNLDQPYDQQQSNQEQIENQREQADQQRENCNCDQSVKTKYIAIEIPKIVRVSNTNSQSSNYEKSSTLSQSLNHKKPSPIGPPSLDSSLQAPDSDNNLSNKLQNKRSNNYGMVSKTRIIEIKEIPNTVSKTLLVNEIENKVIENKLNENKPNENRPNLEKGFEKNNNFNNYIKPSKAGSGYTDLTTYAGYEDY